MAKRVLVGDGIGVEEPKVLVKANLEYGRPIRCARKLSGKPLLA